MPTAALRFCAHPSCNELVPNGYCIIHTRANEQRRGSKQKRGYGDAWPKVRAAKLSADPLCEDCKEAKRVIVAREVHHIVKIKDAPELRLVMSNLRSLCDPCHDARSARGE